MDREDLKLVHPLLQELLTKLADPNNTTRECWRARFDWVKAGSPVLPTPMTPQERMDWVMKKWGPTMAALAKS